MILIIRLILALYVLTVTVLLVFKLGKQAQNTKGLSAVFLFPLMILTKKGRENLRKD